jgi:predicted nuclease of predicted toxin-antitoxin system
MKLLVDMNLSPRWIRFLNEAGMGAVHWSAVGRNNAPDAEIMAYAAANGCVVLTHDLDFGAILAAIAGERPSVVQIRSDDVSPDAIGAKVTDAILQLHAELDAGALVTVDPARTRVRLLPLRRKD